MFDHHLTSSVLHWLKVSFSGEAWVYQSTPAVFVQSGEVKVGVVVLSHVVFVGHIGDL